MKKRDLLEDFCEEHNLKVVTQTAGFGIVVTGFIPKDGFMFIDIDEELAKTKPSNAYPHCNIFAIVGKGLRAKGELIKWIKEIQNKPLLLEKASNNNTGIEASMKGTNTYTLKIK